MKKESMCTDDLVMIQKYSDMVYRLAYSLAKNQQDAEDIHQDVFVKYISKRPQFENVNHEKAWFLRVTINLAKNLWKTAWKQKFISLQEYELEEEETTQEGESWVIDVVKKLPEKYRLVIHLFYYEDLSIEEISQLLKTKPATVRTQLTRARRKLKEWLKEDLDV